MRPLFMIKTLRRVSLGVVALTAAALIAAGPVWAGHCMNASKNQAAGVQVVIDANTGEIVWISNGLQHRVDKGLVNPDTGEGFSGLLGLDFNGDAVADISTYIVDRTSPSRNRRSSTVVHVMASSASRHSSRNASRPDPPTPIAVSLNFGPAKALRRSGGPFDSVPTGRA